MAENRSIFQFKKFQLAHGAPGLKIGTEACIFGAYLAKWGYGSMLEIGTGCGVLTAMVAQFHPNSPIDTLEIEPEVAQLAQDNFEQLPFPNLIKLHQVDCKVYQPNKTYDFIFSNPPFFINHLANSSKTKQTAMHSNSLSPKELADVLVNLSNENSEIALIYPPNVMEEMKLLLSKSGFRMIQQIHLIPNEGGSILREIALFSKQKKNESQIQLIVKNNEQNYSPEFKELLEPYYLIFP